MSMHPDNQFIHEACSDCQYSWLCQLHPVAAPNGVIVVNANTRVWDNPRSPVRLKCQVDHAHPVASITTPMDVYQHRDNYVRLEKVFFPDAPPDANEAYVRGLVSHKTFIVFEGFFFCIFYDCVLPETYPTFARYNKSKKYLRVKQLDLQHAGCAKWEHTRGY